MFTGIKVIELASVLAGPAVGQFFAELGAEVIKIENLEAGGDITRHWRASGESPDEDRSAYFCSVNWGKQSIAVNLKSEEGKAIVYALVKEADIVIASYKPGDARKLKMDYETLSSLKKGLIYGLITGYGDKNNRVGYDAVIQAEAGFMFMNGEPGGASLKMPVALIDVLAGHHLKEGLLLALLHKFKTGDGQLVEVSLFQAALASLANQGSNWLVAGKLPQKQGSTHPNIAPYGDVVQSADAKEIILAVGSDRQFHDLCKILGVMDIAQHEEYKSNQQRVINREKLNTILRPAFKQHKAADVMRVLQAAAIPAGIVQNIEEALHAPEAADMLLKTNEHIQGIRSYAGISSERKKSVSLPSPPHFGEHTNAILESVLHLNAAEIEKLRVRRVIN